MILYGRDYYIWRNCGFVTTMIGTEMWAVSGSVVPKSIPISILLGIVGWLVASGNEIGWYKRQGQMEECRIIMPNFRVLDVLGNSTALTDEGVPLDNETAYDMLLAGGKLDQIGRSPRCENFFRQQRFDCELTDESSCNHTLGARDMDAELKNLLFGSSVVNPLTIKRKMDFLHPAIQPSARTTPSAPPASPRSTPRPWGRSAHVPPLTLASTQRHEWPTPPTLPPHRPLRTR